MARVVSEGLPRRWWQALYGVPQVDAAKVDVVTRWLVLSRAVVVVMSATSAALGGLMAALDGLFHPLRFSLAFSGLILAHLGSNLFNDLSDHLQGTDRPDSPRAQYGPHGLAQGVVALWHFALVTAAVLAGATAIGIALVLMVGPWVLALALGGAGILLGYSYLKRMALGEPAVLVVWGPLMVGGTYYVVAKEVHPWVWLASLPYGLAVTAVLMGKHIDKLEFDRREGNITLPVVVGEAWARRLTQALMAGAYVALAAVAIWRQLPGLAVAGLALPTLVRIWPVFGRPKPQVLARPIPGWPLWFVNFAFYHTRRLGIYMAAGLALQVGVEALLGRL